MRGFQATRFLFFSLAPCSQEQFGKLEGLTFTWVGDGNNVLHDLMLGAAKLGELVAGGGGAGAVVVPFCWSTEPS